MHGLPRLLHGVDMRASAGLFIVALFVAPAAAHADEAAAWHPSTAGLIPAFAADPLLAVAPTGLLDPQDPAPPPAAPPAPPPAQNPSPDPLPAHTGFRALAKDTVSDFAAFPRRKSTWVILGIGLGLAGAAHPADNSLNSHLQGSKAVSRFFAPGRIIGAAYTQMTVSLGLYLMGRYVWPPAKGADQTNKLSHLGFDLLRAQFLSQAVVQGVKYSVRRDRPTGECCAFPSGHAATAFAMASVLERHLGYRFAWPTVVAATYVATSRLHDNRHYLSDVIFGAAVGTATGWTVVGRHGRDTYAFVPTPVRGGIALNLTRTTDTR